MRSIEKDKLKEQKQLDEARTKRLNDLINKFENAVDLPKIARRRYDIRR